MRIPANFLSLPAALASFILLASPPIQTAAAPSEAPAGTVIVLHSTETDPTWIQAFQPLRDRMQIAFRVSDAASVSKEGHSFMLLPASASAAGRALSTERLVPLPDDASDLRDLCESAAAIVAAIDTQLANAPARGREPKSVKSINTP